jgi:hypothetical protein
MGGGGENNQLIQTLGFLNLQFSKAFAYERYDVKEYSNAHMV